jgi:hypothetical protein
LWTALAPNLLALDIVVRTTGIQIGWTRSVGPDRSRLLLGLAFGLVFLGLLLAIGTPSLMAFNA